MSQPFLSRAGSLRGWGLPADCTRLTILRLYNSSSSRIQDSYNLRQSMLRLSEKGQWNEAVQLVQRNTKHNDQSYLPVWSSLVVEAFRAGKNATALSIWAQAVKRGLKPDSHFYLKAFAAINPSTLTTQSQTLQKLNHKFAQYLDQHHASTPSTPDALFAAPVNAYIDLLQRSGHISSALSALQQLPQHGLLVAENRAFTSVFHGLTHHPKSSSEEDDVLLRTLVADRLWSNLLSRTNPPFEARHMVDSTTVQAYIHFLSWQPRPEDHLRAVWLAAEIHGLPTNGRIPTEARTHRANVFVPKHPSALKPDRSLPGLTAALNVLEDNNDAHAALQWVKCLAMRPSSRHSLRPKDWMLALKAARRQSVKGQGLVYDLKQLYEPWRAERQTLNHTDPSIKVPPSFYLLQEAFQPTPQTTPHYRLVVKQERKTANRAAYTAKRRQQRELRTESDRGQRQGRQTRTVDGSAQPRIMQQWLS